MNAYELADAVEDWETGANYTISIAAAKKLRQQANIIKEYERVLVWIANDYPELSYDKAKLQNLDHIKWAKEVLQNVAMDNLVAWQQEFENSAQLIGNKPTSYAKLKEEFE